MLDEFIEDCAIRGMQQHSIETYKGCVKEFLEQFPHPEKVTQQDLRIFLKTLQVRELKVSTQKRIFSSINTFYKFLVFEGISQSNPIEPFRERYLNGKDFDSETRRLPTIEEVRLILSNTDSILYLTMFLMYAKTGMRRGEALDLKLENINLEKDLIHIPIKAKRSRNIAFMDDELHEALESYLDWRKKCNPRSNYLFVTPRGYKVKRDYPGDTLKDIATELNLHDPAGPLHQRITIHCFRHFFTTNLHRAGMNEEFIKWLRGDSLRESWQIYNHIDSEAVRKEYYACVPSLI